MCMRGAYSEREDLRRVHGGPIPYENVLLSFGSRINLTTREKVSVHWGNYETRASRSTCTPRKHYWEMTIMHTCS